jgi:hypothetical protein
MKDYLALEMDWGVINLDQFQTACSAWRQSLALMRGIFNGNARQVRSYYQACGDLMHKLRQVSKQENEGEVQMEIDRLRGKLISLAERI